MNTWLIYRAFIGRINVESFLALGGSLGVVPLVFAGAPPPDPIIVLRFAVAIDPTFLCLLWPKYTKVSRA